MGEEEEERIIEYTPIFVVSVLGSVLEQISIKIEEEEKEKKKSQKKNNGGG